MRLLVYGTLKKGFGNNCYLQDSKLIETGFFEVENCSLRADKDSPFPFLLRKDSTYKFQGEIYEVSEDVLSEIDYLEGHPSFYKRIFVKPYNAYTYIIEDSEIEKLPIITIF